jgi:branched-chain amino acid transport system substrate-binding protein
MQKGLGWKCLFFIVILSTFCSPFVLAQDNIKIGLVHVFSGPMRTTGQVAKQGADLAVKEINENGGINGRKLEIVVGDTKLKADAAKAAVTKLVNEEKVDIVMGTVSSAVAKAVTPLMNDLKCPFIVTHAMTNEVTGSLCNPWTFRIMWNVDQCYKAVAMLANELGANSWTTVGPDYGYGQDSWSSFKKYLGQFGDYKFLEPQFTPVRTKDWKPVIQKIIDSGAKGVMLSIWGKNCQDFILQAHQMKFFEGRKVVSSQGATVYIFFTLGFMNMPKGVWFGAPYWFEAYDNPANEKFVEAYKSLSMSRIPPSSTAYTTYAAVKMFKAAVEKAGSTDRTAVAKALSGLTVTDMPVGRTTFRAEDHQAVYDVPFGATSSHAAKGTKTIRGLDPIKLFPGAVITPPASEGQCKMPNL